MARSKKNIRVNQKTDARADIDVQTAFMPAHDGFPAGGLAVAGGHEILAVLHRTEDMFGYKVATVDAHADGSVSYNDSFIGCPPNTPLHLHEVLAWTPDAPMLAAHALFDRQDLIAYLTQVPEQMQIRWNRHAPIGSLEARLHPALRKSDYRHVIYKGTDPKCDSYSGIRDNIGRPTGLADRLKRDGRRRLFVCGLALDFCVGFTALDAIKEGFEVFIIEDATRSVDMPGTIEKMRKDLDAAGVKIIQSNQLRAV